MITRLYAILIVLSALTIEATNSPRPAWSEQVQIGGQAYVVTAWTNLNSAHSWVLQTAPTMDGQWASRAQHWTDGTLTVIRPTTGTTEFWRLVAGP